MEFSVIFFRALAFFLSCFIVYRVFRAVYRQIALGDRHTIRRSLIVGIGTAVCVFATVYCTSWYSLQERLAVITGDCRSVYAVVNNRLIHESLGKYKEEHGTYPDSIADLSESEFSCSGLIDPWGSPWQYAKTGDHYRLYCLGRDGKPGGIGLDQDFDVGLDFGESWPVTFWEFALEGKCSLRLFVIAIFTSLSAGLLGFIMPNRPQQFPEQSRWMLLLSAGGIVFMAFIVAFLLIAIYVIGSSH
jgi:hypothetical protein